MLHFEGSRAFSQPVAEVWSKLSDARFLVQCIPGVEAVTVAEPDQAACRLRPGFAFVRGTLDLTLRIVDVVAEKSARLELHSQGIGSTSDVEATLNLEPQGDGTQLQWTADIKQLGGLLKAVPSGLVQAAAQKVIGDAWAAVAARMGA
jgi:carbon monoxide dehydrogenase subunit G